MWTRACRRWPGRTIVEFAPRRKGCCGATTTTATPSGGAFQLFEIRSRLLDGIPHYYSPLWCHVRELLESHHHRPCIIIKSNPPNFYFFFIFRIFRSSSPCTTTLPYKTTLFVWPFSFFQKASCPRDYFFFFFFFCFFFFFLIYPFYFIPSGYHGAKCEQKRTFFLIGFFTPFILYPQGIMGAKCEQKRTFSLISFFFFKFLFMSVYIPWSRAFLYYTLEL